MISDAEAPPAYNSIFGQLKQQKSQSGGLVDYTKNASSVVKSTVGGVCGLIIFILCLTVCSLGLPIAEIVIGAIYKDECHAQYLLPIYLIVLGAFSLVTGCGSAGSRASNRDSDGDEQESSTAGKASSCCSSLIGLFLFCWFICGNVWVFQMKKCDMETFSINTTTDCFTTDVAHKDSSLYCNQLLYDFVYWETVARWAVLGLVAVLACFGCCIVCCVYCCTSS